MPPTLVNVAVGVLIGVSLLGAAFDRRSLAVVAVAAALPDFDAVLSLLVHGTTNAALHSAFVPLAAAGLLYWDTERREESWLRARYGWYGVRVAWVAVAAYAVAGIGLDLFNIESVAVLYPLSNDYYAIVGKFVLSTQEGVVQTYVEFGNSVLSVRTVGTTESRHIATWVNPTAGTSNPPGAERTVRIVDSAWQLVVVIGAIATIPAKFAVEGGRH
ncbi:metal-dependent hydrolase [Natronomonas amylolytica]|uniref:metal-dependent hydrolase n=1 Tax=Natronomonas amylolytica TaxID=3108498 RepID=UPI003008BA00